jgi:hypothetical protein
LLTVHGKLDRLLRGNADELWPDTSVESPDTALVRVNLLDAVKRVAVEDLAHDRGALVLQSGLDQVDRVDCLSQHSAPIKPTSAV